MFRLLLTILVIGSLVSSTVTAEERKELLIQHEARENRVWSVWLQFQPCGVTIDYVFIAKIDAEGKVGPWSNANTEVLMLQWTYDPDPNPNYGVYDLLGDMAQTRYVVRIVGRGQISTNFSKNLWVSPAGFSSKPIKAAPLRDLDKPKWNVDDWQALTNWYMTQHAYSTKRFFQEFKTLLWHADKRMILNVKLGSETCLQSNSVKEN